MSKPRPYPKVKPLVARLPMPVFANYTARGSYLIRVPIGEVLGGFLFEGSQWSAPRRYVRRFVLPLWVHQNIFHLSHGDRLRRQFPDGSSDSALAVSGEPEEIDATIEVMIRDGLAWIEEHLASEAVYRKEWRDGGTFYNYEMKVMAAVFLGLFDQAREYCSIAIAEDSVFPYHEEWSLKNVQRIREMYELLTAGREVDATAIVQENIKDNWERFKLRQFD